MTKLRKRLPSESHLNPFAYGVVVDDSGFCNRKAEIQFLKKQIRDGYSTWLFSPRRFGKTSLVEKVFRETEDAICVYFDLYNVQSVDDFVRRYAKVLSQKLFDWKEDLKTISKKMLDVFGSLSPGIQFDDFGNPNLQFNVRSVEKKAEVDTILEIPQRIAIQRGIRICIAFDEFQEIQRIDPFLLNWLRSTFQRQSEVSYIFLGSKESLMESIFLSTESPFYEFAAKMDLPVIPEKELADFIRTKFTNSSLPIEQETIAQILFKSKGQPHFTQYFASVVFDLIREGTDQREEGFQTMWMDLVLRPQSDVFQGIYDQLTNIQRSVLMALASLGGRGIYSEDVRKQFELPASSSIREALKALQKRSLIHGSGSWYAFSNPIFQEWVHRLLAGR
ncbi:MAG: ATP-binding protein [Bacteroidales bacterium]